MSIESLMLCNAICRPQEQATPRIQNCQSCGIAGAHHSEEIIVYNETLHSQRSLLLVLWFRFVARFQLFPEQFHEILHTTVLCRLFQVCTTIVLRRFPMLELVYLLMYFLHTSVEGGTSKQGVDQFSLAWLSASSYPILRLAYLDHPQPAHSALPC